MKTLKVIQLILVSILSLAVLAILINFIMGQFSLGSWNLNQTGPATEQFRKTSSMEQIYQIEADVTIADISIVQTQGEEITIIYRAPDALKDRYEFSFSDSDVENTIKVTEKQKGTHWLFSFPWNHSEVKLELQIPAKYMGSLLLSSISGETNMPGNYELGFFSARSTSGEINLGSIKTMRYEINSVSGDLRGTALEGEGSINSTSGEIQFDSLKGNTTLHTVSGDINTGDMAGMGSLSSISGSISTQITEVQGNLDVTTVSGGVEILLKKDAAYLLSASSISGDIEADFPLTSEGKSSKKVTGQFGENPTYQLVVKTTSGDITFRI